MPVVLKKTKPATVVQSTAHTKKGQPDVEIPKIAEKVIGDIITDGSKVQVEFGRVWSDGDYGSYRVGVSVTLPCLIETVEQAYSKAYDIAQEKMAEMLKGTKAEVG